MKIACSKGCGYDIDVDKETVEEILATNQALRVQHDVCPTEVPGVQHRYRIRIELFRDDVLLGTMGDSVQHSTFKEAIEPLGKVLQDQWSRIVGMADIVEDDDDEPVQEKDDEPRCKLATCGLPLPDDLVPVGYCTSEHEREDNE